MSSYDDALAIRSKLAAAVWPGIGGELVFGKVVVSAGVDLKAGGQLRFPFCMVNPGELEVDDETPDLVTQRFSVHIVQSVSGDPWGETVLIGGPGPGTNLTSRGRGLLELEQVLFDTIALLQEEDSLTLQWIGTSAVGAQEVEGTGYVAERVYDFETWTGAGSAP